MEAWFNLNEIKRTGHVVSSEKIIFLKKSLENLADSWKVCIFALSN